MTKEPKMAKEKFLGVLKKGLTSSIALLTALQLCTSKPVYSENNQEKKIIVDIGGRYNLRGEANEEPSEALLKVQRKGEVEILDKKLNFSPYILYLHKIDSQDVRRLEAGIDIGKSKPWKGVDFYLGLTPKITKYNYNRSSGPELGLSFKASKNEPLNIGKVKVTPFFENEWNNFYNLDRRARNELKAGVRILIKKGIELEISENHIDESFGGKDTDMVMALVKHKFSSTPFCSDTDTKKDIDRLVNVNNQKNNGLSDKISAAAYWFFPRNKRLTNGNTEKLNDGSYYELAYETPSINKWSGEIAIGYAKLSITDVSESRREKLEIIPVHIGPKYQVNDWMYLKGGLSIFNYNFPYVKVPSKFGGHIGAGIKKEWKGLNFFAEARYWLVDTKIKYPIAEDETNVTGIILGGGIKVEW